ncbi:unnamed protein product, partial [Allacma fusca]
ASPTSRIFDNSVFVPRTPPSSVIVSDLYASKDLSAWIANHSLWFSYDWLVTAETFKAFLFIWVITKPSLTHSALWDGFEKISWILLIMSVSMVILALKRARNKDVQSVSSAQIVVFLLLEQGQLPSRKSLKILGVKASALISLWALMCIVISNGYKGNMFSLLTAISSPEVPRNLDQILNLKTPLITGAAYEDGYGEINSLIHQTIYEVQQHEHLSSSLNQTISRLSNKVVFTTSEISEMISSQTYQRITVNKTSLPSSGKMFELPKAYIYIGEAEDVSLYSMLLAVTKKKPLILPGPNIDLFWQRVPMLVLRNFFTEVYKQAAFQIVESGLWHLWEQYENVHSKLLEMKKFIQLETESNYKYKNLTVADNRLFKTPGQRKWNILRLIWGKSIALRAIMVVDGLKTEAFTVVFTVYAVGNLVGLAGCIIEICFVRLIGTTSTPIFLP